MMRTTALSDAPRRSMKPIDDRAISARRRMILSFVRFSKSVGKEARYTNRLRLFTVRASCARVCVGALRCVAVQRASGGVSGREAASARIATVRVGAGQSHSAETHPDTRLHCFAKRAEKHVAAGAVQQLLNHGKRVRLRRQVVLLTVRELLPHCGQQVVDAPLRLRLWMLERPAAPIAAAGVCAVASVARRFALPARRRRWLHRDGGGLLRAALHRFCAQLVLFQRVCSEGARESECPGKTEAGKQTHTSAYA